MIKIDDENNVYLTRGDTATLRVNITDASGEPYSMLPADRLIFTVRRLPEKGSPVIDKTVAGNVITISTDDTKELTFGKYKFDIYLYNSSSNKLDTFIAERIFEIGEEVHEFE